MKKQLKDILELKGVMGIAILSIDGEISYEEFPSLPKGKSLKTAKWFKSFFEVLKDIKDADIIFDKARVYIKRASWGYALVFMDPSASPSMVRLNCDLMMESLNEKKIRKKLRWPFLK